ncbi:MAG: PilZ domain-containing protein [Planctomycetota bacterium]|jgi:hypothetical protein
MPDSDGAGSAEDQRDAGADAAGEQASEKKETGPKAVPQPSLASRDKPVPKPVRPKAPSAGPPRASPVPTKASRDAPVPRPVRPASPAQGTPQAEPAAAGPAQEGTGTIFGTTPATPSNEGPGAPAEGVPRPERSSFSSVKKTTRPGTTQAMRTGSGDARKARFTRHVVRGQDRVTIREDIDVAYRFLGASGPDLYPDTHRGKLVDLSLTGAQIEGPLPDDPPRRELLSGAVLVRSKAELPFVEEPLVVDSQVSWIKRAQGEASLIGLKFAGLTQKQTNLIRAFFIGLQSPARQKFRRGR